MTSKELREGNVVEMFHPEKSWIPVKLSLEQIKSIRDIPGERYFRPIFVKDVEDILSFKVNSKSKYLHQLQNVVFYVEDREVEVKIKDDVILNIE